MNIEKVMTLYGENATLLEELYENFSKNPQSVSQDWQAFFQRTGKWELYKWTFNKTKSISGCKCFKFTGDGYN